LVSADNSPSPSFMAPKSGASLKALVLGSAVPVKKLLDLFAARMEICEPAVGKAWPSYGLQISLSASRRTLAMLAASNLPAHANKELFSLLFAPLSLWLLTVPGEVGQHGVSGLLAQTGGTQSSLALRVRECVNALSMLLLDKRIRHSWRYVVSVVLHLPHLLSLGRQRLPPREVPVSVPPAFIQGSRAQIRVLLVDLGADGQPIGDVSMSSCHLFALI